MRRTLRKAVVDGLRKCDCPRRQKTAFRMAYFLNRNFREMVDADVEDYLVEEGAIDPRVTSGPFSEFDPEKWEKILQLLIKYLPQLIEIFVNLFSIERSTRSDARQENAFGAVLELGPEDVPSQVAAVQTRRLKKSNKK